MLVVRVPREMRERGAWVSADGSSMSSIAAGVARVARAPGAAVFPGSGTLELLRLTRGQSAQGP